jgi:hypothetical protein
MAYLENDPRLIGQGDDPFALVSRRCDRLLQQQMDTAAQQGFGHGQVGRGGNHDGDGIDLIGESLQAGESRAARFLRHDLGSGRIGINHAYQPDLGETGIDKGMETTQIAHTDNGNPQSVSHGALPARGRNWP